MRVFLLLTAMSLLAACSPPVAECGPDTCPTGCCSAAGQCEPGSAVSACGTFGGACSVCSFTQSCVLGACGVGNSGGGTGGGTGGGSGGGTGGGGGVGGGSGGGVTGGGTGGGSTGGGTGGGVTGGGSGGGTGGGVTGGGVGGGTGGGAMGGGTGGGTAMTCMPSPNVCAFNVNSITVGGSLTVNGAPPLLKTVTVDGYNCTQYTDRVARLTFKNLSSNASVSTLVSCANPAAYSLPLVAGNYEVRISNGGGANVPGPDTILAANLALTTTTTTQNFNVNALQVGGALTVNGMAPVLKTVGVDGYNCTQYTDRVARLTFTNLSSNASVSTLVSCANPAAYSLPLVAGSYEVRISNGGGANVPGPDTILAANLALTTTTTTQNFNLNGLQVGGALTVNGQAPVLKTVTVDGYNCTQYTDRVARLTFTNLSSNASVSTLVSCANPAVYSLPLVAGTYEVRIANGGGANVPGPDTLLNPSLSITASTSAQNFNVNSITVGGALTVNGAAPVLKTVAIDGYNCTQYTDRVARLTFKNLSSNASVSTLVSCANPAAYSLPLVGGNYEVRIANGGGANVPGPDTILAANLPLTATTSAQNFNVNGVNVSGTLTVNFQPPVLKTVTIDGYNCTQYTDRVGRLTFTNLSSNASVSTLVSCANPAAFSISLVSGVYEIRLSNGGGANVPGPDTLISGAMRY